VARGGITPGFGKKKSGSPERGEGERKEWGSKKSCWGRSLKPKKRKQDGDGAASEMSRNQGGGGESHRKGFNRTLGHDRLGGECVNLQGEKNKSKGHIT